ncbi:YceI family protein [Candidatus Solirubrobacter pratensis]|uniref:YceI family protein n=1 Tax=Candidatus Solirubrobacter pratensis TaxID=1298857 RepID=UPI00040DF049|nr:YceI family protein [Candidatus Solirubrobacter pratensis]
MSTTAPAAQITDGAWQLDPARSSVEFHVRHFYGLVTVKGAFADYDGTLQLGATPAVELTLQAASLDTKMVKRDEHLRSGDFFDVEHHPQVRFVSERAELDGDTLRVQGRLHAAGRQIPLELDATVRELDDELEIEAVAEADHRELGMTWSPLGILRAPASSLSAAASCAAKGDPTHASHRP